jgi:hypothetical protein
MNENLKTFISRVTFAVPGGDGMELAHKVHPKAKRKPL